MKKIYAKFLLMNTLATFLLALVVLKAKANGVIFLFMLLFLGYIIGAAVLFRKNVARFKEQQNNNDNPTAS